jgi:hypothetical protein
VHRKLRCLGQERNRFLAAEEELRKEVWVKTRISKCQDNRQAGDSEEIQREVHTHQGLQEGHPHQGLPHLTCNSNTSSNSNNTSNSNRNRNSTSNNNNSNSNNLVGGSKEEVVAEVGEVAEVAEEVAEVRVEGEEGQEEDEEEAGEVASQM